jgi:hypothetical protein
MLAQLPSADHQLRETGPDHPPPKISGPCLETSRHLPGQAVASDQAPQRSSEDPETLGSGVAAR